MENSVSTPQAYSSKIKQYNNQLRLLKEKHLEQNIFYKNGHQFTINLALINFCSSYINNGKSQSVVILDDYDLPVRIENLQDFYDDIIDIYQQNLNSYIVEYEKIVQSKGEIE